MVSFLEVPDVVGMSLSFFVEFFPPGPIRHFSLVDHPLVLVVFAGFCFDLMA